MKLYGRLLAMANLVEPGENIADIGTDHGLLPIFLYKKGISSKVVLTDVNPGPLEKAAENFRLHLPSVKADLRMGNGLETLKKAEVDVVVIAGMGGELIGEILGNDLEKTRSFKKFILQPRSKQVELRRFLHNYAFEILKEKLVREGKFICEIMVVNPFAKTLLKEQSNPKEIDLEISPLLFTSEDPLLEEFIKGKINKEKHILEQILESGSDRSVYRIEEAKSRIKVLEGLRKDLK